MTTFFIVMMIICTVLAVWVAIRNPAVFLERNKAMDIIFKQEDYLYYLGMMNSVSYDKMMFHFWVWPVRKMWPIKLRLLLDGNRQ